MKAWVLTKPGRGGVAEVRSPVAGRHDTLLRVRACALCGTDAKAWAHGHRDLRPPRILGHEICAEDPRSGRRFVVWPGSGCGSCGNCVSLNGSLCQSTRILGFHRDGGLAERLAAPTASLVPVDDAIPDALAALAEPTACALNGIETAFVKRGDRVLIVGGGPVGLLAALAARDASAEPFVLEARSERLDRSAEFRERLGIQAGTEPPRGEFDAALNAAPDPAGVDRPLALLRAGGHFAFFSGMPSDAGVPARTLNEAHHRRLTVHGAYGCTRDQMVKALAVIGAHREAAASLVDAEIPLDDVTDALPRLLAGDAMRLVVRPA